MREHFTPPSLHRISQHSKAKDVVAGSRERSEQCCCFHGAPAGGKAQAATMIMNSAVEVVDAETEAAEADVCCANCGTAEVDNVKLEECNDCDLVKYCRNKCREEHREEHEEECKNRKVLLHDRKLFTQPDETHLGECPLCFLPLPLHPKKSAFYPCCSEAICLGCVYANCMSNKHDRVKASNCPFCREPISSDDEESQQRVMKRIEASDPDALRYGVTNAIFKEITIKQLNITQKQLNWEIQMHIVN
jgi:hypothetical protein